MLEWDFDENRMVYRHVLPRDLPLRIASPGDNFVQGKSMNQVYGMSFSTGRFVQVLDCNQGGHATEYLKFPSLLNDFRLDPSTTYLGPPHSPIFSHWLGSLSNYW